jgi:PAS domain S-box-containing protein
MQREIESDRKYIEATAHENELRSRYVAYIVESSDDAIVSKNLDGIIMSWNRGAERIFGYTADEAIGQPITMVIPADRQSEEREILSRLRRGERIDHFETVRQRKDGNLVVVSLTVSPVKNSEGKIIGASKIARDITQQKRSQDQIAMLAREAEHRSKNLLATVQAIVKMSNADKPEELKEAIEGRIQALANVVSLFAKNRWLGAELSTIASHELAPYSGKEGSRARLAGPAVILEPDVAQALAIILHELATNAAKYGALSLANGQIDLEWQHEDGRLTLGWKETGGPAPKEPSRAGFGRRVIAQSVARLKGETHFDWREEGLICEITFPM